MHGTSLNYNIITKISEIYQCMLHRQIIVVIFVGLFLQKIAIGLTYYIYDTVCILYVELSTKLL